MRPAPVSASPPARPGPPSSAAWTARPLPPAPARRATAAWAPAAHSFSVKASDALGNADPTPAVANWTIDTTPPLTSAAPAGGAYSSAQLVTLTASEAATIRYTLNGATPTTGSPVYSSPIPISATTTLQFFAVDAAGNTETVKSVTYVIDPTLPDTTAPETTLTAQPASLTTATSANFSFTASEAGATFQCRLDGAAFAPCASPQSYSGLGAGGHSFSVKASDAVGNTDPTPAVANWTIDTTPPLTSAAPAGGAYSSAQLVTLTASEAATIRYTLNGATPTTGSPVYSSPIPISATTTLQFFAVDAAGNTETVKSVTYVIDTTAPDTTITAQPSSPTNATSANFSFTASEAGATFQCRLDGAAFAACTSPQSYSGLGAGGHSFSVKASDAVGNTDPTPAVANWTIDTTPPLTSATPAGGAYSVGPAGHPHRQRGGDHPLHPQRGDPDHRLARVQQPDSDQRDHDPAVLCRGRGREHRNRQVRHLRHRHDGAGDDDHGPAVESDQCDQRQFQLHRQRGRGHLPVPPRRRGLCRLRQPAELQRPGRRRSQLQRESQRCGGQHRSDAGGGQLDDRHHPAADQRHPGRGRLQLGPAGHPHRQRGGDHPLHPQRGDPDHRLARVQQPDSDQRDHDPAVLCRGHGREHRNRQVRHLRHRHDGAGDDDHGTASESRPMRPAPISASPPARPGPPSSAAWTARPLPPAPARRATAAWAPALTASA